MHDLFTFTISQSGRIAGAQPRFYPDDFKLILKWFVMAGQADNQGKLLLNVKIVSTLSVCGKFGHWKMRINGALGREQEQQQMSAVPSQKNT